MKQQKRNTAKNLLVTALMIGAVAGGFYGITQTVVATENGKVVTLPTSYPAVTNLSLSGDQTENLPVANAAEKPDYTIVDNGLDYYKDKKPTANDISREEAAAIGVKALEDVFGIDLAGKTVEMAYEPAHDGYRAYWQGDYWYNGKKQPGDLYVGQYFFSVDAITGEVFSAQYSRVLDANVNTGFDASLNESGGGEYRALAEKAALEHGAIKSSVKEIEYAGLGSVNNDPNITFNVTGIDGERAQIQLSRYDNELLAVVYDAYMREMDVAERNAEEQMKEFEKEADAYFRENPDATFYAE